MNLLAFVLLSAASLNSNTDSLERLLVIDSAKKYFKEEFVEATFKNPYSYELLKIEATPVSRKDALIRRVEAATEEKGTLSQELVDKNFATADDYQNKMDSLNRYFNKKGKGLRKSKQWEYDFFEGAKNDFLTRAKEYQRTLNKTEKEIEYAKKAYSILSEEELSETLSI